MSNKILGFGVVVAIILAITGIFLPTVQKINIGAVSPSDTAATNYTEVTAQGIYVGPLGVTYGDSTGANTTSASYSLGTCTTASTTIFAATNPFTSTSTAQLVMINVTGQATSTLLSIGTSTRSTGLSSTDISPTGFVNATVPTSTLENFSGGVKVGSNGYVSAGASTNPTLVVGPSQFIAGYATSSSPGSPGFVPTYSSCTYKILWNN